MENRDNFRSRIGVLLALAGSAIGLGNLWRFPYLLGTNGGAAFIIIYLFFVFIICLPIMFSEFTIGRRSGANAFGAYKILAPKSKWGIVGILAVLTPTLVVSFYSVVGGWTIDYMVKAAMSRFSMGSEGLGTLFSDTISSPVEPIIYMLVFLALSCLVVAAGVEKGIEKYTKIMMPALFIMIIVIAVRSVTLKGAGAGLSFLFNPDFSKVTGQTFLDALGQAFFSLSLGCGTIITYASYVAKKESIVGLSSQTAIADTTFALLAGVAIMPAVFAFGISPSQGPGLVFVTLPYIFFADPVWKRVGSNFLFRTLYSGNNFCHFAHRGSGCLSEGGVRFQQACRRSRFVFRGGDSGGALFAFTGRYGADRAFRKKSVRLAGLYLIQYPYACRRIVRGHLCGLGSQEAGDFG